jgi:hypothetical protein
MPAISFLKAAKYQDGHAGYSNPLDEQKFLADTINHLQILPEWKSTAVIVLYDDSDGWYDHVMPPIINQSNDPSSDALLGAEGLCGHASLGSYQDRCGYGPRQPLLVISPYAKVNYIDHQITDQSSVLRFIEENWNLGRIGNQSFDAKAGSIMNMFDFTSGAKRAPPLFLDSSTGSIIPETYYKLGNGIASGDVTYAGHIKLEGLLPDTNYYYKVWFTTVDEAGKTVADPPSYGTFKTAPDPSENKPVSFVMGGDLAGQQYCSRVDVNFPIFNAMKALGPDFFIFNGDEIYADNDCPASGPANVTGWNNIPGGFPRVNDPSVNWTNYSQVHDIYLKHWQYNRADPNLQSLLRNVSMYSQADDHEVANNWAPSTYYSNSTMSRAGFPNLIKAGIQEFFNFSPIDRNADEPDRIYRSFHWGKNVDLFIADQHQYRSRNDLPDTPANNKTLLGKEQLHWLEQGILNSNATWKIVSPLQRHRQRRLDATISRRMERQT